MIIHRITGIEALGVPILRLTFEDGLTGEYDLSSLVSEEAIFAPLKDEQVFRTVALGPSGRSFGWNLDNAGQEIDICADAARIRVETSITEKLADRFERRLIAAT